MFKEWELVISFFSGLVTFGQGWLLSSLHICLGASLPHCSTPPTPHLSTRATHLLPEGTLDLQCGSYHEACEPRNRP